MVPDGDRRQIAESRHPEDNPLPLARQRRNQIVAIFVLSHHVERCKSYSRSLEPAKQPLECVDSTQAIRHTRMILDKPRKIIRIFHCITFCASPPDSATSRVARSSIPRRRPASASRRLLPASIPIYSPSPPFPNQLRRPAATPYPGSHARESAARCSTCPWRCRAKARDR